MLPYVLQLILRQGLQQKLHCSKLLRRISVFFNIHVSNNSKIVEDLITA
jgi:hypothetical protein